MPCKTETTSSAEREHINHPVIKGISTRVVPVPSQKRIVAIVREQSLLLPMNDAAHQRYPEV